MMRSKSHHPWQPRVSSDSPAFNPFSHGTETEIDLSTQIEEAEQESRTAAAQGDVAAANDILPPESVASAPEEPSQYPSAHLRWHLGWLRKLTRH